MPPRGVLPRGTVRYALTAKCAASSGSATFSRLCIIRHAEYCSIRVSRESACMRARTSTNTPEPIMRSFLPQYLRSECWPALRNIGSGSRGTALPSTGVRATDATYQKQSSETEFNSPNAEALIISGLVVIITIGRHHLEGPAGVPT